MKHGEVVVCGLRMEGRTRSGGGARRGAMWWRGEGSRVGEEEGRGEWGREEESGERGGNISRVSLGRR